MSAEIYEEEYSIDGKEFVAIGVASTKIKAALKMLGIPSDLIRRASVIAYEAEMNVVIHGGGGIMKLEIHPDFIEIIARDEGPGIPDISKAMEEGFSTATDKIREMGFGAGMGLPNIKRNSDNMEIKSEVGKGTEVHAVIGIKRE
ncbi:MAG: ATP-binding protein [Synergistaceae bacterium]|nr:ATP-binding protein [Synergistaceae bacterium]